MPIASTDIDFHLSGATGTPATSLGGAIHATQITDASLHNLFDIVNSTEANDGDTEYRCFYVKNNHGSLSLQSPKIWIQTAAANANVTIAIALATAGINGTAETEVDESTAPTAIGAWESGTGEGNALLFAGDLPFGQHQAVWVRRVITAAASADDLDAVVIRCQGDTAE